MPDDWPPRGGRWEPERRTGLDRAADVALWVGRALQRAFRPLRRLYGSTDAIDNYTLVHMTSVAGDALVAIALADSVFFSLPVGEAKTRVALYLGLTMAPLAAAAPAIVPLLDRAGPRRAISFAAAAGRAGLAIVAAPRFDTLLLFPLAFVMLVLSKVHLVTKNGLTAAYAGTEDGLVRANARISRLAVVGAMLAIGPGILALKVGGAQFVLYVAAGVFAWAAFMSYRLPHPPRQPRGEPGERASVGKRGRMPHLTAPAAAATGMRGASGFMMFLLAFALRGSGQPAYWFGAVLLAGMVGTFLGDVVAPRLSERLRDEAAVLASLLTAGVTALLAFAAFDLPILMLFGLLAGAAAEFGRLAFQSLMQRTVPAGAQGRVFVRYEIMFQMAWVAGAFLPAILPIPFRTGILLIAAFILLLGLYYVLWPRIQATRPAAPSPEPGGDASEAGPPRAP